MVLKKLLLFKFNSDLRMDLKNFFEYLTRSKFYIFLLVIFLITLKFIATYRDVYTSKTLFFIRRPISAPLTLPGIQGAGAVSSSSLGSIKSVEDARIFTTYIKSNKVNSILKKEYIQEVKECTANSTSLNSEKFIDVTFSELSGIIKMQVSCVKPKQAQQINLYLLKLVENYSDNYNNDLLKKQTQESKNGVREAIKNFNSSLEKLTSIQMEYGATDISYLKLAASKRIELLEIELINEKKKLGSARSRHNRIFKGEEPIYIKVIEDRIKTLEKVINDEKKGLGNENPNNINIIAAKELKAKEIVEVERSNLAQSRAQLISDLKIANEQSRYVSVIDQANLPSKINMNKRVRKIIIFSSQIFVSYLILSTLLKSLKKFSIKLN